MVVETIESIPPSSNPFIHDVYNMGTQIGTNVMVMYEKFQNESHRYIIVVNIETGERLRITL